MKTDKKFVELSLWILVIVKRQLIMKLNPLYLVVRFHPFGKSTVRIIMPTFKKNKHKKNSSHKQCLKTVSTVQWKNINLNSKVLHEDIFAYEANNWTTSNLFVHSKRRTLLLEISHFKISFKCCNRKQKRRWINIASIFNWLNIKHVGLTCFLFFLTSLEKWMSF